MRKIETDNSGLTGSSHRDRGFTLVEILIVVVILGILASVTVFAVRGVSAKSQDNACATELKTYQTAAAAYFTGTGAFPATLSELTPTYVRDDTSAGVWEISGENVSPVVGGKCESLTPSTTVAPGSPATTTPGTTPATTPATTLPSASSPSDITYAGQPAKVYGTGTDVVLLVGNFADNALALAAFNRVVDNGVVPSAQVIWVDSAAFSTNADWDVIPAQNPDVVMYFDPNNSSNAVLVAHLNVPGIDVRWRSHYSEGLQTLRLLGYVP